MDGEMCYAVEDIVIVCVGVHFFGMAATPLRCDYEF